MCGVCLCVSKFPSLEHAPSKDQLSWLPQEPTLCPFPQESKAWVGTLLGKVLLWFKQRSGSRHSREVREAMAAHIRFHRKQLQKASYKLRRGGRAYRACGSVADNRSEQRRDPHPFLETVRGEDTTIVDITPGQEGRLSCSP